MKAARLHDYEAPLSLDRVPDPEPRHPTHVVVRVAGAGVCRTDLHAIDGVFRDMFPREGPLTLGHECAGWVAAVGNAVTSVEEGAAVIVHPLITCGLCGACRRGDDMRCPASDFPGLSTDGSFAEYLCTSERAIVKLPDGVDPVEVAPHADAGLTAYRAARKAAAVLRPGDTVAVVGVGGLGHIAVQILRALTPARIVGVDRSDRALALAREVGADDAVPAAGCVDVLRDLTRGAGATVVIDFVGEGSTPADGIAMLGPAGTYVGVGYGGTLTLPTMDIVGRELSVSGCLVGTHAELQDLMELVAAGRVRLRTERFALEHVNEAIGRLRRGEIHGRAVLVPGAG